MPRRDVHDVFPQVIEDGKQWWKLRNRSGQTGYVPFNILDVMEEPESVFSQVSRRWRPGVLASHPGAQFHSHLCNKRQAAGVSLRTSSAAGCSQLD